MERLSEQPHSIIIVTGPRQVGKTTLVRNTHEEREASLDGFTYEYFALDAIADPVAARMDDTILDPFKPPDIEWLVSVWNKARIMAGKPDRQHPHVLVLDEIQKLDRWSDIVKGLWDEDRHNNIPLHVVLLGSSPLLMRQGLQESLAGRFETINLNHWSFVEMNAIIANLTLPQYLYFGGYPGLTRFGNNLDSSRWFQHVRTSLIETTIEADVLMMRRVDKPALLKQLFELGCRYSGQIVSYGKLKGELVEAGNETTLAGYLELLGNAGLLKGLHKYARGEIRRRKSPPKLQVLNTALMSAWDGRSLEAAQADTTYWGRLVESAVGAHLHNAGDWQTNVFYWREGGNEVDFVVERGDRCLSIEVKSNDRPAPQHGLDAFASKFPGSERLIIGGGGVPVNEFLQSDPDDWFDWSSS